MAGPKHPRHYEESFKRQIVQLYENGKPSREIRAEYDIARSTPRRWVQGIRDSGSTRATDNRTPGRKGKHAAMSPMGLRVSSAIAPAVRRRSVISVSLIRGIRPSSFMMDVPFYWGRLPESCLGSVIQQSSANANARAQAIQHAACVALMKLVETDCSTVCRMPAGRYGRIDFAAITESSAAFAMEDGICSPDNESESSSG